MHDRPADNLAVFISRAHAVRTREHLPAAIVDLLEGVSSLQEKARGEVCLEEPDTNLLSSAESVAMGRPLLPLESFPFDKANADGLMAEVLRLMKTSGGAMEQAASLIDRALQDGSLATADMYAAFLHGHATLFDEWTARTPDAPKALMFVTKAALEPSLRTVAETLADHLDAVSGPRHHGSCPICGSLPLIARLEGKEGVRLATCSNCLHEYRVRRLSCLFCDESDHEKLTFFTVAEEPGYRVDVCESCGNYLKTIDFRQMDRTALPILDDLDSLALDFVARENGYTRTTLSAWGF